MKVFIIGITGGIGHKIAQQLIIRGHEVRGLVRKSISRRDLPGGDIQTVHGDLVVMSAEEIAAGLEGYDAVVFSAGAGGREGPEATTRVDGEGPAKVAEAARIAGVRRFMLISVFPEAWRERPMPEDFEHYMSQKKNAEIKLVRTDLDWVILRPSSLSNEAGLGRINLGPAEIHSEIPRDDVAATLVALLEAPAVSRRILEVTNGTTGIGEAVASLKP